MQFAQWLQTVQHHMLSWLYNIFFSRDLLKELDRTKTVKINGFKFTIKKINPLDHFKGSKVLLQAYDVLKIGKGNQEPEQSEKKIKEHLSEVILVGVVHPKITAKDDGDGIFIDKLFYDYELVNLLYSEIIAFSYGKKKIQASK